MTDTSAQMKKVIQTAIDLEKEGFQFYKRAEENTNDPMGKKMFDFLAREEVNHIKVFSEIFDEITGSTEWRGLYNESKRKVIESPLIKKLEENYNNNREKGETEAIRIAMDLERQAIDFFTDAQKNAQDTNAKEAFRKIVDEEEGHFDLLQAQLDSLNNTGMWFDVAEFQMDGKF